VDCGVLGNLCVLRDLLRCWRTQIEGEMVNKMAQYWFYKKRINPLSHWTLSFFKLFKKVTLDFVTRAKSFIWCDKESLVWFQKSKWAHMCCSLGMFLGMWQRVLLASREGSLKCDKRIENFERCDMSRQKEISLWCIETSEFLQCCDVLYRQKNLKATIYHKRINLLILWNVKFSQNFLSFSYHKEANFHAMRCITSN
jgi:hypothetical protein